MELIFRRLALAAVLLRFLGHGAWPERPEQAFVGPGVGSRRTRLCGGAAGTLRTPTRLRPAVSRASAEDDEEDDDPSGFQDESMEPMRTMEFEPGKIPYAALAAAVVQGKDDVAFALLGAGAGLEDKGARGITAAGFAAQKGDLDMLKHLADKGANLEARDETGRSILVLASIAGQPEVVQYLFERGVDLEVRDRGQLTALLWASLTGKTDVVRCLVEKGANTDVVDADGMTALKLAAIFNKVDVVKVLVDAGGDPKTALALVQKFPQCKDTVSFLSSRV
ncbi:unnamed protein product [Polarella glacialis]|uniref:Uncharacterized protein n=1 Tax=Polarella glacialis TaxID=89957 RepID=A0A813KET1_POLGL|nr:unnamed protein product [Polarella glacialis]